MTPFVELMDVYKTYSRGENQVNALTSISLKVNPGEFVAIMGASGSGKSTLMNLLGCLDRPTSGTYLLDGADVTKLPSSKLAELRSRKIGFIFQGFLLLPRMTAIDNVRLPMVYSGVPAGLRRQRAESALASVGLAQRAQHRPNELSGGQQQRVAIARALVNSPGLILADEPTGNLDSHTSIEIMAILQRLNDDGTTIMLVTHEPEIAEFCSRTMVFRDGVIVSDEVNRRPKSASRELAVRPTDLQEVAA